MNPTSERWIEISPSQFLWEREALAFVRERLPDHEPYRAWSNFEFIADDGSINEVDLLLLTPKGFYLVEIKSRGGVLDGDAGTWTWRQDGRVHMDDNPLVLANRKAKKLASLLRRQKAVGKHRVPFVEAVVFLSATDIDCRLAGVVRQGVHLRDVDAREEIAARPGIVAALTQLTPAELNDPRRDRIDRPIAKAVTRAMEEAGVRPSQKHRKVGDYTLAKLLGEGPGWQDFYATHGALKGVHRRVRLYLVAQAANKEAREMIVRAAHREFRLLEGIEHPGILRAADYKEHSIGPALVFEHDPQSLRFDHFLAQRLHRFSLDQRLQLVRQVAEALRFAHDKKLYHRALSPLSILVRDPDAPQPRLQIFNWQTGAREVASATGASRLGATNHLEELVEGEATAYMAPESLVDPAAAGEALDVFSLGAVTYHILTGRPPAGSMLELRERLRAGHGLRIAAVQDGAKPELQDLVQGATRPEVSARLDSVAEFLDKLDEAQRKPEDARGEPVKDPGDAAKDDLLEGGFRVKRRLGKGSTAIVFLVERGGREEVLKVASDPQHNDRLKAEGEVLEKLRHAHIVELFGPAMVSGRYALRLAKAGDQTLARRLREEGPLSLDLLQRFGSDLLDAVRWLERQGIPHRDIKPDNIGVAPVGRGDLLHVVLFDFSLSRTRPELVGAGTAPYLDPFIGQRERPRWDEYAERFAAAMTLHEMATASLPRWGDGKSHPQALDCEVSLDGDLFPDAIREPLSAFFTKALARDHKRRHDNAEDMLRAWEQVFEDVDRPAVPTDHEGEDAVAQGKAIDEAELDTPLMTLGLTRRAINALERANVHVVRDLVRLPPGQITHMRGVGNKTRRELTDVQKRLVSRFPVSPDETTDGGAPESDGGGEAWSVDVMVRRLVPQKKEDDTETTAVRLLLGLADLPASIVWPSQTVVGDAAGVTRARIGQILAKSRERWNRQKAITRLRDDLLALLVVNGGVMTVGELAVAVLATRGSAQRDDVRGRFAMAVTRAAVEAELHRQAPRFIVRRHTHPSGAERILVASDEHDGQMLVDLAIELGHAADWLAAADSLASSARAVEVLQAIVQKQGLPAITVRRLVQLACAASSGAALSPRLEIYPKGLSAERALKLAHGVLLGAIELSAAQIQARLDARYPEAERLPGRPELDDLLRRAGSDLVWEPGAGGGQGAFRSSTRHYGTLTSGPTSLPRYQTTHVQGVELPPELAEAQLLDERLLRSASEGGFLILTAAPRAVEDARKELARRFPVDVVSLESRLLFHLRREAEARKIRDWNLILRADAASPDSRDWRNLKTLVGAALKSIEPELSSAPRTTLLVHAGLLAHYDEIGWLEALRDRVSLRRSGTAAPIHGLWVLVPTDDQHDGPVLDNKALPVITRNQWARLTEPWVTNAHRSIDAYLRDSAVRAHAAPLSDAERSLA